MYKKKTGVDPNTSTRATIYKTSDDFFKENKEIFDIIFIDGLHLKEQVYKDIKNSLKFISKNGVILLHDCNPWSERVQDRTIGEFCGGMVNEAWTGDVWKSWIKYRKESEYLTFTFNFDCGIGCIDLSQKSNNPLQDMDINDNLLTYKFLDKNRQELLDLTDYENFSI